jgi:hypothetical protein
MIVFLSLVNRFVIIGYLLLFLVLIDTKRLAQLNPIILMPVD